MTAPATCRQPGRCLGDVDRRALLRAAHGEELGRLVEAITAGRISAEAVPTASGPMAFASVAAAKGRLLSSREWQSFSRQWMVRVDRAPRRARSRFREVLRPLRSLDWRRRDAELVDLLAEAVVSADVAALVAAWSGPVERLPEWERQFVTCWIGQAVEFVEQLPGWARPVPAGCACRGRRWP